MIDYKLSLENIRNILLINSKIYCKNRHFYVTLPSKNINFVFTIFYNENLLKEKSNIYHLAFSPIFNSIISYNYFTTNKIYPPVFFITNNYLLAILLYKFEQIEKNKVLIKGHLELNIFNKIARRNLQYSFSKSIELIEHYFRYFILNKEVVISLNKNLYNRQLVDIEKIDSITVVKKFYINNILYYYKDLLLNKRKDISILMESKKDKEIYKKVYYPRINFLIGINFNNIDTSLFTKKLKIYTTIENNIDPFSF